MQKIVVSSAGNLDSGSDEEFDDIVEKEISEKQAELNRLKQLQE